MILTIYIAILIYFFVGGIGFYFINRSKPNEIVRQSYIKFAVYFVIINLLFFSIAINPAVFQIINAWIIIVGFVELIDLFKKSRNVGTSFFLNSLLIYSALSAGFFFFGFLEKELILYTFIVLSIFDSFSQITGQLWGKNRPFPKISPNKTTGGLVGGGITAAFSAFLLKNLYPMPAFKSIVLVFGLLLFAFAGDLAASFYKRKFEVKNYNNLIPGHGGFLDRFDSLIAGGAWVAFAAFLMNLKLY